MRWPSLVAAVDVWIPGRGRPYQESTVWHRRGESCLHGEKPIEPAERGSCLRGGGLARGGGLLSQENGLAQKRGLLSQENGPAHDERLWYKGNGSAHEGNLWSKENGPAHEERNSRLTGTEQSCLPSEKGLRPQREVSPTRAWSDTEGTDSPVFTPSTSTKRGRKGAMEQWERQCGEERRSDRGGPTEAVRQRRSDRGGPTRESKDAASVSNMSRSNIALLPSFPPLLALSSLLPLLLLLPPPLLSGSGYLSLSGRFSSRTPPFHCSRSVSLSSPDATFSRHPSPPFDGSRRTTHASIGGGQIEATNGLTLSSS